MKSINQRKHILLIFADSAVKTGKADAGLLQQYVQGAADEQSANMQVDITYVRSLSFFVANGRARIYDHRNKRDLNEYDFVYFRKAGPVMQQLLSCAVYLRQHNIPYFDTEIGQTTSRNKLSQMFLLYEKGLPIPATLFCRNRKRLLRLVSRDYAASFPFPVIAKATGGTRGDANYLVHSIDELRELLSNERRHFLIQEFIPNDGDYRALVIFHKLRGLIKRSGVAGSHLNNTSKSGTADWLSMSTFDTTLTSYAVRAAQICKRDVAGVDLIINKHTGQPAILEVNRAPQIEGSTFPEEKAAALIEGIAEAMNEPVPTSQPVGVKGVVGRKEHVQIAELPEVGTVIAKVDTGAYSSSLHVTYVEEVVDESGKKTLHYSAVADKTIVHTTDQYFKKVIVSSNGVPEERFIVELHIKLGGQNRLSTVSLSNRDSMRYPMLIGRRFLRHHNLVVDPSKRFHI